MAEDCPATEAEVPPLKGTAKTVANLHFEQLNGHPYKYSSDDVIFHTYAVKNELKSGDLVDARIAFFSKGQPCMRCSPLTKRYGFGVHCNEEGKIALVPGGTKEYQKLLNDKKLQHTKAMRTKKA